MIIVIHGVTGSDNHSAVVGAVEAENTGVVRLAMKRFIDAYGHGPLNRAWFNDFVRISRLPIVQVVGIDYDQLT